MRAAPRQCPACGRANRSAATFCDHCGARLRTSTFVSTGDAIRAAAPDLSESKYEGAPFVGRGDELRVLQAALDSSHRGSTQIILLTGQAGIGKTRIALECAEKARQSGARPHWGRSLEEPGSPPYWPWIQLIRSALKDCDQQSARELLGNSIGLIGGIVPELIESFPDLSLARRPSEPEQARFQLFDGISQFWLRAARVQPLLLILDDLHWADATSLRLLTFLASTVSDSPLMILGTYRNDDMDRHHPLNDTLAELTRIPGVQRHSMSGFKRSESDEFIAAMGGFLPPELAASLHERTEGNPLYLTETIRWASQGTRGKPGAILEPNIAIRIPESVRHIISKRLNRLTPSCNNALKVAAAIGKTFWPELLSKLIPEASEDALQDDLEEALAVRLIEDSGKPGQYQFSHGLVREVLYSDMSARRRSQLHQRIGELFEDLAGTRDDIYLTQLAFHFSQAPKAQNAEKAIAYAARAAKRADELLAYEEASRLYRVALQTVAEQGAVPDARQTELMLDLGEAQAKSGDALRARETFKHAAALARDIERPEYLARAALGFEEASWRPGISGDAAIRLLESALEALPEREIDLRVKVLCAQTRALILTGNLDEADRVNEEGLTLARASGNAEEALLDSLRAGLSARWRPERIDTRLAAATEAMQLAQLIGDDERFLEVLGWRLFDALETGNMAMVAADLQKHTQCMEELRQPFYQLVNIFFKGSV